MKACPRPTFALTMVTALAAVSAQTLVDTKNWTTADDHQNMMAQLGIKALRPGPSGNESAPNHANYDEATANPYPNLPEVLTLKNGKKRLAYGQSPEDALQILSYRSTQEEMDEIIREQYEKISQRKLQEHVDDLG